MRHVHFGIATICLHLLSNSPVEDINDSLEEITKRRNGK